MTDREAKLLDQIFNPYNEPCKQAEPTDVDAHWEVIQKEMGVTYADA